MGNKSTKKNLDSNLKVISESSTKENIIVIPNEGKIIKNKRKRDIKIKEEYQKQLNVPKPILINIFCKLELNVLASLSSSCKQFYFLIMRNDMFWRSFMIENSVMTTSEMEELSKDRSYKEIFCDSLQGWDLERSDHKYLKFEGNLMSHLPSYHLATGFSKFSFETGTRCLLFTFLLTANYNHNFEAGLCHQDITENQRWLIGKDSSAVTIHDLKINEKTSLIKIFVSMEPKMYVFNQTSSSFVSKMSKVTTK
eukprot:TRINITY_DN16924_c0_g1_i1.p1 TRINITY_DN16924_c0_g1~~TRINITY_DN16924_c0_g1_i1.p1  ORF type:complete len:253 (-),score=40.53 TRINITY_DN16924_c0_g1_i1:47-805(-)